MAQIMRRQIRIVVIGIWGVLLTGCLSGVWTGATLIYDRHNVYKKLDDYKLMTLANQALSRAHLFKREDINLELAVFNGDILLVGSVPSVALREKAYAQVAAIKGYRRVFNQLSVSDMPINSIQDSWITTELRSQILADSTIDPSQFKVVTFNRIVYLMGDVVPYQANRVISMARQCRGVIRVVKLFKYYNLSDKASN